MRAELQDSESATINAKKVTASACSGCLILIGSVPDRLGHKNVNGGHSGPTDLLDGPFSSILRSSQSHLFQHVGRRPSIFWYWHVDCCMTLRRVVNERQRGTRWN